MKKFVFKIMSSLLLVISCVLCLRLAFNPTHKAKFDFNTAVEYFDNPRYDLGTDTTTFFNDLSNFFAYFEPTPNWPSNITYGYYTPVRISSTDSDVDSTLILVENSDNELGLGGTYTTVAEKALPLSNGMYIIYQYVNWESNWWNSLGTTLLGIFGLISAPIIIFGSYAIDVFADAVFYLGFIPYVIQMS